MPLQPCTHRRTNMSQSTLSPIWIFQDVGYTFTKMWKPNSGSRLVSCATLYTFQEKIATFIVSYFSTTVDHTFPPLLLLLYYHPLHPPVLFLVVSKPLLLTNMMLLTDISPAIWPLIKSRIWLLIGSSAQARTCIAILRGEVQLSSYLKE